MIKKFFIKQNIIILSFVLLFLCGCSTRKNNFFTRSYHNTTAFFNIYWNGKETLLDLEDLIKEDIADNYFSVLPVLKLTSVEDTSKTSSLTTRIIEKGVKAIKKHSILIRGVEYVKTIDDAYILMGKGFFYKHEYIKARMVFNYVVAEFSDNAEGFEAMLWVARTYMEQEEYDMAIALMNKVADSKGLLNKVTELELPITFADFYIKQEQYAQAVPYLEEALILVKYNNDLKARLHYILGQISQEQLDNIAAYERFRSCLKLNPPLDLVFNARISMALCFDPKSLNAEDLMVGLKKLLQDSKNSHYFGRIYYVLGELSFSINDELAAVEYLREAIELSGNDDKLKLDVARRLAAYYYDKGEMINSQEYYAIAAKLVEVDDEDYYTIVSRAKNLEELVVHYTTLTQADTAKMLANMSDVDRSKYAQKKIKEYKIQQAKERLEKREAAKRGGTPKSKWYFYNQQSKNLGYNEFIKRWGRRKLEDLWSLSTKPPSMNLRSPYEEAIASTSEDLGSEKPEAVITEEDEAYYLQDIPKTEEALNTVDSIIEEGLYHVGLVYFDRLDEDEKGEKYFLRLIKEYPNSKHLPNTYENLCKIYHKRGDVTNFKKYANLLSIEFPGSEQDKRINDPDYFKKIEAAEKEALKLYEAAYQNFMHNQYAKVLEIIAEGEEKYPINTFNAQFMYLKAIALAHVQGYAAMIPILEQFLISYPKHDLEERVRAILVKAKKEVTSNISNPNSDAPIELSEEKLSAIFDTEGQTDTKIDAQQGQPKVEYKKKQNKAPHFVMLIIKNDAVNLKVMEIKISDFIKKNYIGEIQDLLFEGFMPNYSSFTISDFTNVSDALKFYNSFISSEYIFGNVEKKDMVVFVISVENMVLLNESKNFEAYEKYFEKNYIKE